MIIQRKIKYADEEYKKLLTGYNITVAHRISDEKLYVDIVARFQNIRIQELMDVVKGLESSFYGKKHF